MDNSRPRDWAWAPGLAPGLGRPRFLQEDQRGYYKKKTAEDGETAPEEKPAAKKAATKAPAKKTAAKKTAAKKTTVKKTAARTTAKRTTKTSSKKESKA